MAGRPRREEHITIMTLRLPQPLLERVNRCKALVELHERANLSRTEVLWTIIEAGCEVMERQLSKPIDGVFDPPVTIGSPLEEQDVSQVEVSVRTRLRETVRPRRALPDHILRIAEERAVFQYSRLSFGDFAQHLFDTGIYRARTKDGQEVPVNRGTLKKWLDQAAEAGVL